MAKFYLIWQDPVSRHWHPVGMLKREHDAYIFAYTKGALASERFIPFGQMNNLKAVYLSQQLFPIFANRVMSEKRPEYATYAKWAGFEPGQGDPLLVMARMGGLRATDTLQVYQAPERNNEGKYRSTFYCHGIRHMPKAAQARALECKPGDKLFPLLDVQNPFDKDAVALRTEDPTSMIGYCPRHVSMDVKLLCKDVFNGVNIVIDKVNDDAPNQFQLLLTITAKWPERFEPCSGEEYQTLLDVDSLLEARRNNMKQGSDLRGQGAA